MMCVMIYISIVIQSHHTNNATFISSTIQLHHLCMAAASVTPSSLTPSSSLLTNMSHNMYVPPQSVLLDPAEFAQDAEHRLGKANGNIYRRQPSVENVHDGQLMVRLKKKRFIIIDYGYVPNATDHDMIRNNPYVTIPEGAGAKKCKEKTCNRIGVPVLLYDSEPDQPPSLYIRTGLCYCCQRNLNEKRRTQRKRKSDGRPIGEVRIGGMSCASICSAPSSGYMSGRTSRFTHSDTPVQLSPDAMVINCPVEGTSPHSPTYRCPEIGSDLLRITKELSDETSSLVQHSRKRQEGEEAAASSETIEQQYEKAFKSAQKATFLLTQWKASYDTQQRYYSQQLPQLPQPQPQQPQLKEPQMKEPPQLQQQHEAAAVSRPVPSFNSQVLDDAVASIESALGAEQSLGQHAQSAFDGYQQQQIDLPNENEAAMNSLMTSSPNASPNGSPRQENEIISNDRFDSLLSDRLPDDQGNNVNNDNPPRVSL